MGATIHVIPSDGNCLYHAILDQLLLHYDGHQQKYENQLELRRVTAQYIRQHGDDFAPFLTEEQSIEEYCLKIEQTNEWGGQLELQALSNVLCVPIHIFTAASSTIEMGQEYTTSNSPPLMLTYHQHYYALGEHYNSVHALRTEHLEE